MPSRQAVQVAAAEEVPPDWPYLPAAHTEPEQVEAPTTAEYLPAVQLVQTVAPAVAEYLPASQPWHVAAPAVLESLPESQLMQTDEPVVRAQRQTTSQIHMHMYICIEDVCVCVPIFIMYVCIICMNECMHVYTHTHNDL